MFETYTDRPWRRPKSPSDARVLAMARQIEENGWPHAGAFLTLHVGDVARVQKAINDRR